MTTIYQTIELYYSIKLEDLLLLLLHCLLKNSIYKVMLIQCSIIEILHYIQYR